MSQIAVGELPRINRLRGLCERLVPADRHDVPKLLRDRSCCLVLAFCGPQAALDLADEPAVWGRLSGLHLLPTVRGELLARLGRTAEARAELELAARLCRNTQERVVLLRKADALPREP